MSKTFASIFLTVTLFASFARADVNLIMVEESGCMWCAAWNNDIGHIYAKTGEGQAAPLVRIDKSDQENTDVVFVRPLVYTPTFVFVVDGVETGRIEGYPGEDFFWGLLGQMLTESEIEFDAQSASIEVTE
jgi:hypothetical protein